VLHVSLIEYGKRFRADLGFSEGNGGRALLNGVTTTGGSSAMTVDLCLAACQNAGYVLAGAEYSGECCRFLGVVLGLEIDAC
jgi:hypothetical protein